MLIDRPLPAELVVWRHPCDCASASRPLKLHEEPEHRFDVDGRPFPWHLAEDRPAEFRKQGPLYRVSVRILPVTVDNRQRVGVHFNPPEGYPIIGGVEFPWAITDDGLTYTAGPRRVPILELTFLANHVDSDLEIPELDT
jgi:hypothetical protein